MSKECPFCHTSLDEYVIETSLTYAKRDLYPVSRGHTLIIPKRHIATFFEATEQEREELINALETAKRSLQKKFNPDGFNIGINEGAASGQTVMHLHIHLIPRYKGDMEKPEGGVRGCIPEKQKY
ncbi:MAG: HIT family protein [Gammaproteobacteria bacterium]|nr:MAG: HIT family protein [Gammaproteobacteria bacterium]